MVLFGTSLPRSNSSPDPILMKMSLLLIAVVALLLPVAGYLLTRSRATAENPGGSLAGEPTDPAALYPVRVKGK